MGCLSSKEAPTERATRKERAAKDRNLKRPKWRSEEDLDQTALERKRAEFWDTQPAYGGAKEVWDALKAVAEDLDNPNSKLILESAGISYQHNDIRTTYDEKGFKYDLPDYVLSDPSNLKRGRQASNFEPGGGISPDGVRQIVTPIAASAAASP